MAITEQARGNWAALDGYEEHIAASSGELVDEGERILGELSVDTVRSAAYHPNGFLVTKLRADEAGQLRLHIWPPARSYNILPHTHPWHMSSLVLAGTYIEFLPTVELDDAGGYELMVPNYNSSHQQVGVRSTGRVVSFLAGMPHSYDAGQTHSLPGGAFHSTLMPSDGPVITLMRAGPQLFDNPFFVRDMRDHPVTRSLDAERPNPTEAEAQAIWAQLQPILP